MVTFASPLSRRKVLADSVKAAAALGTGGVLGACTTQRDEVSRAPEEPRGRTWRLGLDTYTLHRTLTAKEPGLRHDLWWVLDQLEPHGLSGVQIDPSHFPGDEEVTLDRLESIVKPRGHYVEFGMGGWTVERLQQRIALTARFGGRAVRTFCGGEHSTQEEIATYLKWAPPALHEAGAAAEAHGVDIAVENHGDFTSEQMVELLERADHPRVGCCLDTANSLFRREDPIACATRLAVFALSMHLKDWDMTFLADGSPHWTERVLGEGEAPVGEILGIVLKERPGLYIALETPVQPSEDEAETVRREWRHFEACAAAAHAMLADL